MSDSSEDPQEAPPKRSKMPMILGLVLALAGGGGGFYATWSGMILSDNEGHTAEAPEAGAHDEVKVSYVAMDPIIISLPVTSAAKHLQFRAHLEVTSGAEEDVEHMLPRVVDVFNSYLRAVDPRDLENPAALPRLRAQMLRRVQVVTGLGKVNDLLIMEFVLT